MKNKSTPNCNLVLSNKKKKSRFASILPTARAEHPGTKGIQQIRGQHVHNLVACMKYFAEIRDDASLAYALYQLFIVRVRDIFPRVWQWPHADVQGTISEVVKSACKLLARYDCSASSNQLKGMIRKLLPYQSSVIAKGRIKLEIARISLKFGDINETLDILVAMPNLKSRGDTEGEIQRQCLIGSIIKYQWDKSMSRIGNMNEKSKRKGYRHDASLWAKVGRDGKEFHSDAVKSLSNILHISKKFTGIFHMLLHLNLATGNEIDARNICENAAKSLFNDADAQSLCLCSKIKDISNQDYFKANKSEIEKAREYGLTELKSIAQQCERILGSDPSSTSAVDLLLYLGGCSELTGNLEITFIIVRGLCTYLSSKEPLTCGYNTQRSFRCIAEVILQLSTALVESSYELRVVRHGSDLATSDLHESSANSAPQKFGIMYSAKCRFDRLVIAWNYIDQCLQDFSWWLDSHLSYSCICELKACLAIGEVDAITLSSCLIIKTFMTVNLVGEDTEEILEQNKVVAEHLICVGEASAASHLLNSIPVISHARMITSQDNAQSASICVSLLKSQKHRDKEALCDSQHNWGPTPANVLNPDISPLTDLPSSWWENFPMNRTITSRGNGRT